jgi:hypothetical protein
MNCSATHTSAASPSLPTVSCCEDFFFFGCTCTNAHIVLFVIWAPLLFVFYTTQMMLLAAWKPMHRNFAGSIFAACTFNFGPRVICVLHLDEL